MSFCCRIIGHEASDGYCLNGKSFISLPFADDFNLITRDLRKHKKLMARLHDLTMSMGLKLKPRKCKSLSIKAGKSIEVGFFLGNSEISSILHDTFHKFLGGIYTFSCSPSAVASVVKGKIRSQLDNIDRLLVRNEYKVRIYTDYYLGSLRFLFSVHDLHKRQLDELEALTHSYLKRWLGMPQGASWALVHDSHGLNVKSISHLYLESRSLTLSSIRFFSDGRVRHALDSKEAREVEWRRKFSSATYAKGLIEEVVTPVVNAVSPLTVGNALDSSLDSWSSLGLDGTLSPLFPPPTAPLLPLLPAPSLPPLSPPQLSSSPTPSSSPSLFSSSSSPNPSPVSPPPLLPPPPSSPTSPSAPPSSPHRPPSSPSLTKKTLRKKIQRGVQERVNNFWKEKIGRYVMQGDYLALIMEEGNCISWKSYMWDIPQGVLKFALNAGINTLPSLDNLKRWGKRVNDRCQFCGNIETLAHVLSNCSTALNQGRFTWRHNSVLCSIIDLIRPHLKEGMVLFSDMPGYQAPHGGTIPPHILATAMKPDIFIYNELSQEAIVFELTCPWDTNIDRSHSYKSEKYAPLIADLTSTRVVSFYPIEVSARGQITKGNRSRLQSFLLKSCSASRGCLKSLVNTASKASLLSSYSIFAARHEPTWEDPAPMVVR